MAAVQSPVGQFQTFAKSYRYLRIGLVGTVLLLAASVWIEVAKQDCIKGSISAYYHTPVRAVFVGGLMAIGFGLIILRGDTDREDTLMNLAGMLAPIVAMVPTNEDGLCLAPGVTGTPSGFTRADLAQIDNNLKSLFVVGVAGVAVGAALGYRAYRNPRTRNTVTRSIVIGLSVAGAAVIGLFLLYWQARDFFLDHAHGTSAVVMFALLGFVSFFNGRREKDWRYLAIGVSMGLVPVVFLVFARGWNRQILAIEIGEIALFALYWILQTIDTWGDEYRYRVAYHNLLLAQAKEWVEGHHGPGDPSVDDHARVLISRAALARAQRDVDRDEAVATLGDVVTRADANTTFADQAVTSWKQDLETWHAPAEPVGR